MTWLLIAVRCACGAGIGVIPGALIAHFGDPKVGISVGVLGGLTGTLLALPGVSFGRTLRLMVAILVNYNVKGTEDIYQWVDRKSSPDAPSEVADGFYRWVAGADIVQRRSGLMIVAFVVGLVGGGIVAGRELVVVSAQQPGIFLPLQGAKDSLIAQAGLLTMAVAIWFTAFVSILAAPAFGRPVQLGVVLGSFFGYAIGYASDNGQGANPLTMATFLGTSAAAAALVFAASIGITDDEPED